MMPGYEFLQPTGSDMCIDLSRRDIGMTQHFLQRPEIGAVIEEMRREGVAQDMG